MSEEIKSYNNDVESLITTFFDKIMNEDSEIDAEFQRQKVLREGLSGHTEILNSKLKN